MYQQHNKICDKCQEDFIYFPNDVWWDENGYGYSTKLTKCPFCGATNVIKYIEDRALQKLNRNEWEY